MKYPLKTHRLVSFILIAYVLASPYDLTPPLKAVLPQLSAEWVDLLQLPLLVIGFYLLLRERQQVRLPLWGAELLIVTGSLIAMTQAGNLLEATETLLKDVYMYLFFIMVVNLVKDRGLSFKMLNLWQVLAVLIAGLMIFSAVTNIGEPVFRPDVLAAQQGLDTSTLSQQDQKLIKREALTAQGSFYPGRQRGTFANSVLAGQYMAQAGILILGIPFTRRRWLQWLSFAVVMGGTLTTGSNGALGSFLVAVAAYVLLKSSSYQRLLWLGLGLIGFSLLVGLLTVLPPDRLVAELAEISPIFEEGVARAPESVESRTSMLASGFRQWSDKPVGLAPHGMRESTEERNTHNDYGAYLFERGVLGFTGLVLLLGGAAARAIYSGLRGDDAHRRLMATLLGVMMVTIVIELSQEFMREREIWLTMAMVVLFGEFELRRRRTWLAEIQAARWPWTVSTVGSAAAGK